MRSTDAPCSRFMSRIAVVTALLIGGCTSPPSVTPLLRISSQALTREAARLDEDATRDAQHVRQSLSLLDNAFDQDLDQTDTLTPDWVREATRVYIAAREALVLHGQALTAERRARADNLHAAASATRRAIELIEQQDRLLNGVAGGDVRRLLTGQPLTDQE